MDNVLLVTGTIFLLISVGYVCFATALFDRGALAPLGQFVVSIALPALIFRTFLTQDIEGIANPGYLGGYLFGSLLMLGVGYFLAGLASPKDNVHRTFDAAGMACANSGLVGRGGSVRLNSFRRFRKWISRSVMLRPGLVAAV